MGKNKQKYLIQSGCYNCKFCFVFDDYKTKREYYCNCNDDRPLCGSSLLKEEFADISKILARNNEELTKYEQNKKAWEQWAAKNQVHMCGICINYWPK